MGVLPSATGSCARRPCSGSSGRTAKIQDEVGHAQLIYRVVEDLGKPRSACLDDLVSGKAKFHNVFHYPTHVGRRRRHRVARRRGRDRLPEGAPQVLVRAVRADHEEDLLGGVVPHPPRPRRDPRDGHGDAGAIRARPGGARPLVEPLMHFHGNPIPAEEDPMYVWRIKSQANEDAPGVPRRLRRRSASWGSRSRPEPAQGRNRPLALHRARLGEAAGGRHRPRPPPRSGSLSDGCRDRTWRGSSRSSSRRRHEHRCLARARHPPRKPMIYEVFRQERKGQPLQHAGTVTAPNERFARSTRASSTDGGRSRSRSGSCRATP